LVPFLGAFSFCVSLFCHLVPFLGFFFLCSGFLNPAYRYFSMPMRVIPFHLGFLGHLFSFHDLVELVSIMTKSSCYYCSCFHRNLVLWGLYDVHPSLTARS
jgi:hypothetical protein